MVEDGFDGRETGFAGGLMSKLKLVLVLLVSVMAVAIDKPDDGSNVSIVGLRAGQRLRASLSRGGKTTAQWLPGGVCEGGVSIAYPDQG